MWWSLIFEGQTEIIQFFLHLPVDLSDLSPRVDLFLLSCPVEKQKLLQFSENKL